ncbi:hypothetical protein RPHASCH2410_PD00060 (plasmid) [Rhizobium phaseoli Ch24-10]|nr:hypothetical protein RHECNPAF_14110016 [Rhizobium etli CNPAF512]KKZ83308.1 hypothetical protein RPHASCH2410_PD00060 [Rhizobium phaseoli Ch24-10]
MNRRPVRRGPQACIDEAGTARLDRSDDGQSVSFASRLDQHSRQQPTPLRAGEARLLRNSPLSKSCIELGPTPSPTDIRCAASAIPGTPFRGRNILNAPASTPRCPRTTNYPANVAR